MWICRHNAELIQMIKESGIVFSDLETEAVDMPFEDDDGRRRHIRGYGWRNGGRFAALSSDKSQTALQSIRTRACAE
jgi:NADH-quinone oxidoreductase subunit G